MIDAKDKGTQALPLEEMPIKRKRGRPSTGKAMTPAEKQRAYRERQKQSRDQKETPQDQAAIQAMSNEMGILIVELNEAKEELRELRLRLHVSEKKWQLLLDSNEKLVETVRSQKEQLESRDQNSNSGNVTNLEAPGEGVWTVQFKLKGSRSWYDCDPQIDFEGNPWGYERTKQHVKDMAKMKGDSTWRAVRNDGLVYDPKAVK